MQARPNQSRQNVSNNLYSNPNNNNANILDYNNNEYQMRNKSNLQTVNGNIYLPPLNDNNISNYNANIRNIQSRERDKTEFQQQMMVDNITKSGNNNQNESNFLVHEINNLKKIVKKLMESQADSQSRLNDYTKICTEQDSNFRINNIKLNEHDSKITEILMTFNNYLTLNDQSTKVINDLTSNYDSVAKKAEVVDIRNKFSNFDKIMESKMLDLNGKYEDLLIKYQEISK